MTARGWSWLALLATAGLAVAVGSRTLGGGLLSDDLLLDFFTDRTSEDLRADFSRAFADFARPWLDLGGALYRPMVSVSLAFDLACGGGDPAAFHRTNVALHGLVTLAVTAMCMLLAPRRKALAALIGGALVALHPLAIEPVAWIAARNSSLEIAGHAAAVLAFASWIRAPRTWKLAACGMAAAFALCSKESAVVLPVSLVAVDGLLRPGVPLRERWRAHAALTPLWLGYLGLRVALLGGIAASPGGEVTAQPFAAAWEKCVALVAPRLHESLALDLLPVALWTIVAAILVARARAALVIGLVWLLAHLAPSWSIGLHDGLSGGRLLYGALLPLAVMVSLAVAHSALPIVLVALAALGSYASAGQHAIDRYRAAWDELAHVAADLAMHAPDAAEERPLVVSAVAPTRPGLPPFNHNGWFTLGARPLQATRIPVFSAGYVTAPTPHAESLLHDRGPLCALLEQGCTVLAWSDDAQRFLARRRPQDLGELPPLAVTDGTPATCRFGTPVPADAVEVVTLRLRGATRSGRIEWLSAAGELPRELGGLDFSVEPGEDGAAIVPLDLSPCLGLLALATLGIPIDGFALRFEGEARLDAITAASRVPDLALEHRLDGASLSADAFFAALRAPRSQGGAVLRLVMQTSMGAVALPCEPGAPIRGIAAARDALAVLGAASRERGVLYWFDARTLPGRPGFARSAVDRFVLPR
ncbi:MAG: hypothetical protein HZB39_18495 [Planctomycetes bacterium]|nr:hypothetical protein [Planctomycetota bacterium]